jgi:hypothetical protein
MFIYSPIIYEIRIKVKDDFNMQTNVRRRIEDEHIDISWNGLIIITFYWIYNKKSSAQDLTIYPCEGSIVNSKV